jgi:hypothetical protein
MQQTLQAVLGAVALVLAGVAVIGALAVLIVVEGYHLIGFSTRLYWRWRESLCQARRDAQESFPSEQEQGRQPLDTHPRFLADGHGPCPRQSIADQDENDSRRNGDE